MHLTLSSWTWLAVTRFIKYILNVFFGVERLMTSVGECNKANSHGDESPPHETVDGRNPLLDNILSRGSLPPIIQLVSKVAFEPEAIKAYVKEHPDHINDVAGRGKDTVLHRIIDRINEKCPMTSNEWKEILEFLLQNGANINTKNDSGDTPLHVAARRNKYKSIGLLIQGGCEEKHTLLNIKNNDGHTCLHVAVDNAAVEVVAILHRYKGYFDEEKENGGGFTAKDIASKIRYNDNKEAMEKIRKILSSDVEKYEREKEYLNYTDIPKDDSLWNLRPLTVYNVTVHDGGEYRILNNCIVNHHSSSNQSTDSPDEQGSQR